jgi:cytoskeletal protein CcmA (bactofilin family)
MADNHKLLMIVIAACLSAAVVVPPASASQFAGGQAAYIADTIEINDDLYVTGQNANVDGHIRGDLVFVGMTAGLDGEVDGSVAAVGYNFNMSGRCRNTVRVLARGVDIDGHIERNLIAFGENVIIGRDGWVEKDVHFGATSLTIQGRVGGLVKGKGGEIFISGQVDGDVDVKGDDLVIQPTAIIGGELKFCGKKAPKIEPGAQILGKISHNAPEEKEKSGYTLGDFFIDVWSFLALILTGGIMLAFCGTFPVEVTNQIKSQWLKSITLGFVFVVCLPIMAAILLVTLIGIPLGLMILVCWVILFYLAKIFGGMVIAEWLLRKLRGGRPARVFWTMILGIAIVVILMNVPFLGVGLKIVFVLLTFGAFFLAAAERHARCNHLDGAGAPPNAD